MPDGSRDEQHGALAPSGPGPRAIPPSGGHGSLMLVLGCIVELFLPFVGTLLIAYGMRELAEARGVRGLAIAAAESAVLVGVTALSDVTTAALLAPTLLCCLCIACCMWHGATVTNVSVAVVMVSLASFATDAGVAALEGLSVRESAVTYLTDAVRQSVETGLEGNVLAGQLSAVIGVVWPFMYVASASFDALVAGIGSHLMRVRCTGSVVRPSLQRFDAPLWSVAVLAISVVCLGASFAGFAESEAQFLRTASVTALLSVRIVFACQGFGVVDALLARKPIGCLTRTVCIFVTFWSEMMFFLMSIVGLIDIWANFRKLPRDGSSVQAQQ